MEIDKLVAKCMQSIVLTHYWHLQTFSYPKHKALQEFYETMQGLVDTFVEAYQGKYDKRVSKPENIKLDVEDKIEYFEKLSSYFDAYITLFNNSLDCQDIVIDMKNLVNKTKYLLTLT